MALVALWASAEQGALTKPPVPEDAPALEEGVPEIPEGSWAKLRNMFTPSPAETPAIASRKGRP